MADLLNSVTAYRREMLQHRLQRNKQAALAKSSLDLKSRSRRVHSYLFNWSHKIDPKVGEVLSTEPCVNVFKPFLSIDSMPSNGRSSLNHPSPPRFRIGSPNLLSPKLFRSPSPQKTKLRSYKLDSAALLVGRIVEFMAKHFRIWKAKTELMKKEEEKNYFFNKANPYKLNVASYDRSASSQRTTNNMKGKIMHKEISLDHYMSESLPVSIRPSPRNQNSEKKAFRNSREENPVIIETVDEYNRSNEQWKPEEKQPVVVETERVSHLENWHKRSMLSSMENPLSSGNMTGSSSFSGRLHDSPRYKTGLSSFSNGIVKLSVLLIKVTRKIEQDSFKALQAAGNLNIESLVLEDTLNMSGSDTNLIELREQSLINLDYQFRKKLKPYFQKLLNRDAKPPRSNKRHSTKESLQVCLDDIHSHLKELRASRSRSSSRVIKHTQQLVEHLNLVEDNINRRTRSEAFESLLIYSTDNIDFLCDAIIKSKSYARLSTLKYGFSAVKAFYDHKKNLEKGIRILMKNIKKDFGYRQRVCLRHWKETVNHIYKKTEYDSLKTITVVAIFEDLVNKKRKLLFSNYKLAKKRESAINAHKFKVLNRAFTRLIPYYKNIKLRVWNIWRRKIPVQSSEAREKALLRVARIVKKNDIRYFERFLWKCVDFVKAKQSAINVIEFALRKKFSYYFYMWRNIRKSGEDTPFKSPRNSIPKKVSSGIQLTKSITNMSVFKGSVLEHSLRNNFKNDYINLVHNEDLFHPKSPFKPTMSAYRFQKVNESLSSILSYFDRNLDYTLYLSFQSWKKRKNQY